MEDLKQWLEAETQDFAAGIDLLRIYSRNKALLHTLSRKENAYSRAKLTYELGKLLGQPFTPAVVQVPAGEPAGAPNGTDTGLPADQTPAAGDSPANPIEKLILDQKEIFNTRAALSNKLADEMSQEARAAIVVEIDRLTAHYNTLAERKRTFEETGVLPAAEETTKTDADPADVAAEIRKLKGEQLNWRSKVSRARKKLKEKPEDAELASEVAKLELELQAIDLKLKTLK